jgi:predicted  nucleic acid-binding Zn-ribbon protein
MTTTTTNNTQTEWKRKAAARKGQATRLRNEARQKRSLAETARTRARAETNAAMATSYEAGRALDTTLGAAVTARDAVVGTVKPLADPRKAISRVRTEASGTLDQLERKGARTRSHAQRRIERLGRQTKRQAQEKSPA